MGFLRKGLFKGVSFRFTSLAACLFLLFFASTLILPVAYNGSILLNSALATEAPAPAPAGEHASPVLSKAEGKAEEGKKDERYDHMAHEFIKVSMTAFSLTASLGGLLTIMFVSFYPDFFKYMAAIFGKTMIIYAILFFGESFCLYIYYYGWGGVDKGFREWVHLTLGLMLNGFVMT